MQVGAANRSCFDTNKYVVRANCGNGNFFDGRAPLGANFAQSLHRCNGHQVCAGFHRQDRDGSTGLGPPQGSGGECLVDASQDADGFEGFHVFEDETKRNVPIFVANSVADISSSALAVNEVECFVGVLLTGTP
jgi:hypothetical protein